MTLNPLAYQTVTAAALRYRGEDAAAHALLDMGFGELAAVLGTTEVKALPTDGHMGLLAELFSTPARSGDGATLGDVVKARPRLPDPDTSGRYHPHAPLTVAFLHALADAEERGEDVAPIVDAYREMVGGMGGDAVTKAEWKEELHPRNKRGVWISRDRIQDAKSDPKLAKQLRAEVKPEDAHKLEAALSGKTDVGRTKKGEQRFRAAQTRQARSDRMKRATELVQKVDAGTHTEDDLHELAGHVGHAGPGQLTADHLRELASYLGGVGGRTRGKLAESFNAAVDSHRKALNGKALAADPEKMAVLREAVKGHLEANPGASDDDVVKRYGGAVADGPESPVRKVLAEARGKGKAAEPAPPPDHSAPLHALADMAASGHAADPTSPAFTRLHDAYTAAMRGEHGPKAKAAVDAAFDDWGSHGGALVPKMRRVGEELKKAGYGTGASPEAPAAAAGAAPVNLADPKAVAAAVHAAGRQVPDVFGQPFQPGGDWDRHKAGIADLYDHMTAAGTLPPGTTLDAFKAALLAAHLGGALEMGRNDLPQITKDQRQVIRGAIEHRAWGFGPPAQFHVVNVPVNVPADTPGHAPPAETPAELSESAPAAGPSGHAAGTPPDAPDDDFTRPRGTPVPGRPDLLPQPSAPEGQGREPSTEELATGVDPGHSGGRRKFDRFSPAKDEASGGLPDAPGARDAVSGGAKGKGGKAPTPKGKSRVVPGPAAANPTAAEAAGTPPAALPATSAAPPPATDPLAGHPLGKTREEIRAGIGREIGQAFREGMPDDPRGFERDGPLPPDRQAAVERAVADAAGRRSYGADFSESFAAAREAVPDLTIHDFSRALYHAHRGDRLRLSGWGRMLEDVPEPEFMFPVGSKQMYYAHRTEHSPGATEPASAGPAAAPPSPTSEAAPPSAPAAPPPLRHATPADAAKYAQMRASGADALADALAGRIARRRGVPAEDVRAELDAHVK